MLKLFKNLKKYVPLIFAIFFLIIIQVTCELTLPMILQQIIDIGIVNSDWNYIMIACAIMVGVAILAALAVIVMNYLTSIVASGFGAIIRGKLFKKVQSFSIEEMGKIGTSSLITRTTNDITQVQQVLHMLLRMILMAPFFFVGGIIFSTTTDANLTMILLVAIPAIAVVIITLGLIIMPIFKKYQSRVDKLNLIARENLTGVRVIRAFNQEKFESQKFHNANADLTKLYIKGGKLMSAMMPLIILVMNFTAIAVAWIGSIQVDAGTIGAGAVASVIQYVFLIMMSLVMLAMAFIMVPRASASASRINEVLAIETSIVDKVSHGELPQEKFEELAFKNVSFTFPDAENPILKNISFTSKAGETTAIIGSTGSGKSSLINLIPRFFDIDENGGDIMINGKSIKDIPLNKLRNAIGFVPQKALLFQGTVADNIKFGKKDATLEEIKHACTVAQANDFIASLDKGYASYVAQGGSNFSGGQKQRLCIARALVRKPKIYIFDDSFSALDAKTDKILRTALKSETQDSTVLIVAQRVSSIMDADKIIVLDEGSIVAMGSHEELIQTSDVYKEIALSQMEEGEL